MSSQPIFPDQPDDPDVPHIGTALDEAALEAKRRERDRLARKEADRDTVQSIGLPGGDLGDMTPDQLRQLQAQLSARISADNARGATIHRRVSLKIRWFPVAVIAFDFGIMLTYLGAVFNLDLNDPLSAPLTAFVTLALAAMGSAISYVLLSFTGRQMRSFRRLMGQVQWRLLGGFNWMAIGASLILVSTVGALMYVRIFSEANGSGQESAPIVLALAFAVMGVVSNLVVLGVHAMDGSQESDDLRRVSRRLRWFDKKMSRKNQAMMRVQSRIN